MKVLLTGGSGQLGKKLRGLRNYHTPTRRMMDITDPDRVAKILGQYSPDLIVHAAAYTDTLKPDNDPAEAIKCFRTNVIGTRNLVNHASCPIIYISTESAVEPYNFYILTKMQGEHEVRQHKHGFMILRTSFRFDPFEYPQAPTDMYTIADTVANIAPLIDAYVDKPIEDLLVYVGTGAKTVFELAKKSRPDVVGKPRAEIFTRLPAMEELLDVN